MKRTILTSSQSLTKLFKQLCLTASLFVLLSNYVNAQCSLTCNPNNVQISLDQNCFAEIIPDDILEGDWDPSCEPFTVVVSTTGGNYVTGNDIGQNVTVTVTAATGNSCSTTVIVSDYLPPVLSCQPATISCFDDPDDVAGPTVDDNCDGDPELSFTQSVQDIGCSGNSYQIITRTYTATDESGNSSSCDQIITVTRPALAQVVFPPNYDDIDEPSLDCANPDISTSNTGSPTIDGQPINNTCDFAAEYTDQVIPICQNSDKILRNWIVYDWCNSTNITYTQTIKILDTTAPVLTCPNDVVISVNSNDCFGSLIVPDPGINDDCSSNNNIELDIDVPEGYLNGNTLYNLPLGTHQIIYTATDDCGNSSTCTMLVTVIDEIPPVAACETNHVVGINGPGGSLVEAIVFDDGSYDNCSDLLYEVRRMDTPHCPGNDGTPFDAFVPFYCCDVGNTVMVELRVTDESGNTNSCMVETTVEDEVNPAITCPPNITIDCNDDPDDLSVTGEPTFSDNCSATVSYVDFGDTDNCGEGTISRTWTATDESGNQAICVQIISFENANPFFITDNECNNPNPNDGVIWPCDYDTNSCGPGLDPSTTGEPQIFEDFCDLIAVTYEDEYLPITDQACEKILRTWLVVDWCQYDENTGEGSWEYTQVIKVLNSDDPVITTDCSNQSFCSYDDLCETGPATLLLEATDDCTALEDLNYYYWIDIDDNGSTDQEAASNDASGTYPLGTHKITWQVEDGCGNTTSCSFLFVIADCKKPTPNVLNGLAIEIEEDCEVEIWATDFDNPSSPSFDNCGIAEWRIYSPSLGPDQTVPPAQADAAWTFDQTQLGTQTVDIWILDINGNWDYVSTYVLIQNNMGYCDAPTGSISGTIEREDAEPVEFVNIIMDGTAPGIPDNNQTNAFGQYLISGLQYNENYVITPEKNINPLNGISTFDLVLISQHILGVNQLDSPYKMIAADVNNNGGVSTIDLVQLRKVILQIESGFQNNTSWRFIDAEFIFPDPENPWSTSFPEVYTVNELTEDIIADFVAVKIGDVNNSADTHDNFNDDTDTRNSGIPYIFETIDQSLKAKENYRIPIYANDITSLSGFQFSLSVDQRKAEILDLLPGNIQGFDLSNTALFKEEGNINISWNQTSTELLNSDQNVLFYLHLNAKQNAEIIDILRLNHTSLKAEAYNQDLEIFDLELAFSEKVTNSDQLYQNYPNPFSESTNISFELASAGNTALSIFDLKGKRIFYYEQHFEAGFQDIQINQFELNGAGIYFYQLTTPEGAQHIKKLVLTDRPEE